MTVTLNQEEQQAGFMRIDLQGWATDVGLMGQVLNPEGQDLHIIEGYLYTQTPAVAAATLNIGIAATGVDASDLANAIEMDKTAESVNRIVGTDLASEGEMATPRGVNWDEGEYLTFTTAAQISTAFRGVLLLKYLRLGDMDQ